MASDLNRIFMAKINSTQKKKILFKVLKPLENWIENGELASWGTSPWDNLRIQANPIVNLHADYILAETGSKQTFVYITLVLQNVEEVELYFEVPHKNWPGFS